MAYKSKYENQTTTKMDYIHTEAHQMAYDLSVYLHKKVREMPHYEKFTLQKDIREVKDNQPSLYSRQAERKIGKKNPIGARS